MDYYIDDDDFLCNYDDDYVNVWIDGACSNNGKPWAKAGYGVFYNWGHPLNTAEPVKGRATNNAGEIQAAICAIEQCSDWGVEFLQINTDSMFLCNAAWTWLERWKRNNFYKSNGDPLANRTDFIRLWTAMVHNPQMDIVFVKVQAHSDDEYNDAADDLAREGASQY